MKRLFYVFLFCFTGRCVFACSGIGWQYDHQWFVGKNHDWINKHAALVVNPRGMVNHPRLPMNIGKALSWTSKYGSITVNEIEKNEVVPGAMAGVNEKGLCALMLWQIGATYPKNPIKPVVSTELFAKYFLDNATTVAEVIELAQKIDVEPCILNEGNINKLVQIFNIYRELIREVTLHLYIQDEKGEALVIEYVKGKMVLHSGKTLPILVLTNSSYDESIDYLKKAKAFGGQDSLSRFISLAYALKIMPQTESKLAAVSHMFMALAYAQQPHTVWSSIFDLSDKTIYIRSIDNQQIKIVDLNKFDFSEDKPLMFLKVNNDLSGHVEGNFKILSEQL